MKKSTSRRLDKSVPLATQAAKRRRLDKAEEVESEQVESQASRGLDEAEEDESEQVES